MDDFDEWSNDIQVKTTFDTDFIEAVHQALMNRWRGEREGVTGRGRNIRPFKSKVWTAASIFDPYYTPTEDAYAAAVDNEVLDYVGSVQNLMQPYFSKDNIEAQMIEMRAEVNQIVLRRGHWGDLIRSFQRSIATPSRTMKSHVKREIYKQHHMRPVASFWETTGKTSFPLCSKLALRISILSVQSADVERMCKAHSIIHTKTCNRLQHVRVNKLLYCYINLHFIEKCNSDPDDFFLSVDDDNNKEEADANNVHIAKAPVKNISISDLNIEEINTENKITKKFSYEIKIADFYFNNTASLLIDRITKETKIKDAKIKKITEKK